MKDQKPNLLINASSPYLLQHAYNPVEWFEWGAEALTKAKTEDKPILVSIGYSACHWCHVMERESFEKESVAEVMNRSYVCIKIDREERPDLDQIYMDAVQILGVNGGWPLNVFLTPDQKPFFGGTYFSPQAWTQILTNIDRAFKANRQQIEDTSEELRLHLLRSDVERFIQKPKDSDLAHDLDAMTQKLSSGFDSVWGGLDKAPKFIMPSIWSFLLRHYYLSNNTEAYEQVLLTLRRTAMGGIYDQVGGGFSRYSVDGYWFIPHFEKMLYDNAQLLSLYAEAYAITKEEEFKTVIYETFTWLQREMTHANGGFFSALDADSEGVEGKYYRWKKEELDTLLGKNAALVEDYYHVLDDGNWEDGYNILMREKSDAVFRQEHDLSEEAWKTIIVNTKQRLLQERAPRVRPGLDDKIITAWNAMTIAGLTDAYKTFDDDEFLKAAKRAMQFLENELMEGHTLYRSFKEKRSSVHAFLDDYAFVIQAYRKLYEVTFEEYYLLRAERFMEYAIEQFRDPADGFFFYTAHAAEALITRKKEIFDNVIPSSNAVMAQNLLHLGIIFDRNEWKEMAAGMTGSLAHLITTEPNYMSQWGIAYAEAKQEMAEIIITGEHCQELRSELQQRYHPFSVTMGTSGHSELPLLQGKTAIEGKTTVYVCYNKTCRLPVYSVEDAEKQVLLRKSPYGPNPTPALRHSKI